MCSPLTCWRGGEGVTLPLAQWVIERPWPATGKYKVNRATIFRLFNFFIHLPPSPVPPNKFTSPSWVCLRSPQAISRVCDLSETFPSAALCLHVHPPLLCVASRLSRCSLETEWELFWGEEFTGSAPNWAAGGEQGGGRRQDRGIFPSDEVMDGWPLSERAERRGAPRPPSTHTDPSTEPLYTLYEGIIALHRAVMWVHWGLL